MEKFNEILTVLKNRRIWVAVIGAIVFVMTLFNIHTNIGVDNMSDQIVKFIGAAGDLVMAGLAIHSYLFPKN